jgi:histidinol-phosphate aminotransferase
VRGPFNVSIPAQRAAAAALDDKTHIEAAIEHNEKWRGWLLDSIRALGLRVDESVANFVLIHFPKKAGQTAKDADAFLTKHGVIMRPVAAYDLPDCLRLTIGSEEANRAAVSALSAFVQGWK